MTNYYYCDIIYSVKNTTQLNTTSTEDFIMNYNTMTNKELNNRLTELSRILNTTQPSSEKWDKTYNEYSRLTVVLDDRYREENEDEFQAFYKEHIEGKSWEEINPEDWDFYSDWHKDMYGYRPHSI